MTEMELAESIASAARSCPDVVDLSAGAFRTVATPVPGGRVEGVLVRDGSVEIGIVARFGRPLPEIAGAVRAAVAPVVPERAVHVAVEDVLVAEPESVQAGK